MALEIAALVLLSAVLHPLWNAFIKKTGRPEGGFLILTLLMVVLAATHSMILGHDLRAASAVWPLVLISWGGQLLYGTCLVATLRRGDLSAYYPIVRSSPALIVLIGVAFLGKSYGPVLLAGIALVLIGGYALQHQRGTNLLNDIRTLTLAVLAMSGTAVYSLSDSRAMQTVPPSVMFFWVEALCLPSYIVLFRFVGPAKVPWTAVFTWLRAPVPHLIAGGMCYASYWLILAAYSAGGDVAAVTSVRQASIPFSILIGGLYLKEGRLWQRLAASLILAAGIVMIVSG